MCNQHVNRRVFFFFFLHMCVGFTALTEKLAHAIQSNGILKKPETDMQHDDCVLISVMFSGVKGHKISTERQTKCVLLFLIT